MKTSGAKQVHYDSGPNMTPLVDVVMVILIFLMLAGSFGSAEHYMIGSAELRSAGPSRRQVSPIENPPVSMDVYVRENGDVELAWDTQPLRAAAPDLTHANPISQRLARSLQQKYAEVVASPGVQSRRDIGRNPEHEVELIIHAGGHVPWEKVAPVYDAALMAKVKRIGFK
jgi:biopolymer transport protein ExbD